MEIRCQISDLEFLKNIGTATRRPVAAGKHQISQSLAPMRCTAAAAASFHSHQLRSRSAVKAAAAAEEAVVPSFSCSNGRKDNKP